MSFFDFIFQKQKNNKPIDENNSSFRNFKELMLQYRNKHIIYEIPNGIITYKNVISPRDGGCRFPEGYFDVKSALLPSDVQNRLSFLIDTAISQFMFSDTLIILPPGASHDALMKCTKNTGEKLFYSNYHFDNSSFKVKADPIHPCFTELFNTLSDYCEFVPLF
ncbi:MAG: hypothetical protein IJC50_01290 [Clostridia bacterium]|nr:hypothetical protein [Clostridia bacterium]